MRNITIWKCCIDWWSQDTGEFNQLFSCLWSRTNQRGQKNIPKQSPLCWNGMHVKAQDLLGTLVCHIEPGLKLAGKWADFSNSIISRCISKSDVLDIQRNPPLPRQKTKKKRKKERAWNEIWQRTSPASIFAHHLIYLFSLYQSISINSRPPCHSISLPFTSHHHIIQATLLGHDPRLILAALKVPSQSRQRFAPWWPWSSSHPTPEAGIHYMW